MLYEESEIIFNFLIGVEGKKILNVCSSDEVFYKETQPYIWKNILCPLIQNGNQVCDLDIKGGNGVDIVCDCTDMKNVQSDTYDIVLFCSGVEHIIEVEKALSEIKRVMRKDGFMICSAPGVYPRHEDPIDTMLRLPTKESWEKLLGTNWNIGAFKKTKPSPAKSFYKFKKLVYSTIIIAYLRLS